ncbi:MAG: FHA domain-containing protein [Proteobacteria bacterium]|nr:FHA domain-containing protein [Pseudomonadota bacterium]
MAILVHLRSGERHNLRSEHLVGRGDACHLRLKTRLASNSHAELRWIGTAWELRDLGSRNGTYVDDVRLDKGEELLLAAGMVLTFGDPDDPWQLAEDSPPAAYACNQAGQCISAEVGILIVPDPEHPYYTVFDRHGQWIVESADGSQREIADGEDLTAADDTWTVHLPVAQERTMRRDSAMPRLGNTTLHFTVSRDQEHIELRVVHPGGVIELPSRVYMELLLRLAEERLHDQKNRDISGDDQGWMSVSDVLGKLGIADDPGGRNRLGQYMFQARKHLADTGMIGAADIVQRRKAITTSGWHRTSQVRIGVKKLEIHWL